MIHDFSIQYAIKNYQYMKTPQEAVNVMRKLKLKSENNNDKVTQKIIIKMEEVSMINQMKRVFINTET